MPSNQENQQTWSRLLAHYDPPSTETPPTETTTVRCHKNSWIYATSTYYWWILRPTITIRFEMKKHYSHGTTSAMFIDRSTQSQDFTFCPALPLLYTITDCFRFSTINSWAAPVNWTPTSCQPSTWHCVRHNPHETVICSLWHTKNNKAYKPSPVHIKGLI